MNEAASFYEAESSGLGDAFLDDIQRAVDTVRQNPGIGTPVGRGFRRMLLRRFPFSLIYADARDEIVLVAVAHQRRRPNYWRRRQ